MLKLADDSLYKLISDNDAIGCVSSMAILIDLFKKNVRGASTKRNFKVKHFLKTKLQISLHKM